MLETRCVSRATRHGGENYCSAGRLKAILLTEALSKRGDLDTEVGLLLLHYPTLSKVWQQQLDLGSRNSETDILRTASVTRTSRDCGIHPNDVAVRIHERPTGVARINRGVGLDHVGDRLTTG